MERVVERQSLPANPALVEATSAAAQTMSISATGDRDEHGFDTFETWRYYEQVAMHFNDLLMRLRCSSLAGVAAFATIAGVLLKSEAGPHGFRWRAMAGVFLFLALLWLAIWLLDFLYYNRLLIGAVHALMEIEKQSKTAKTVPALVLSTRIEAAVGKQRPTNPGQQEPRSNLAGAYGRWWFYSIVFGALLLGFAVSIVCACT